MLANVPQTARVNRKELKGPDVVYQGEPEFQPIEQTKVARAVNTDKDIIRVGDRYYMCYQGVWFVSRTREWPMGSRPRRCRRRSTRFPPARRHIT